MNTIIFDIETVAQSFSDFDKEQQVYLLKQAKTTEEEKKTKEEMSLWALTNQVVAIGLLSAETEKGGVYFVSEEKKEWEEGNIKYWSGTEKEILERFWQAIGRADRFVTFNGRGFDCPVLFLRSAILGVKPSRNLVPYRYTSQEHVDLLDQLQFYGAHRKFNLDFYCKAFGIDSPKSGGISGKDVGRLFSEKQFDTIARYCAGDLAATRSLYLRWQEFLQF